MYNAEKFIEQTVRSVMNQTMKNFEIICVDDCSTDKTCEIVENLQKEDARIVLLKNETNSKVCATRNYGIQQAKSDWIAFLDADDEWKENHLEELMKRQKETKATIVHSSYSFMTHEGEKLSSDFIVNDSITYKQLFYQNKILPSASMFKKSLLLSHPFYADEVHEDFLCWLNILKEEKVAFGVKTPTAVYRLTAGSRSRNKFKAIKMSYNTYKKHGVGFFKRCFYTLCNAINGLRKYSKIKKTKA